MPSALVQSVLFEMREELTCRICLGYLEDASATPCHHVFCKKCIEESLRHHSACPTCRTRITNRALRDAPVTNVVIARYRELLHSAETLGRKHAVQSDSLALCSPGQNLAGNAGSSEADIQSISEQIHCAVKDGQMVTTLRNLLKSNSFQPAALECRSTDERSTPLQQAAAHGNRCAI